MDFKKYENKMAYPEKPAKPILDRKGDSKYFNNYAKELERYEEEMIEFRKKDIEYRGETGRLMDLFRKDALEDVGLSDHPKAEKIYNFAWDHGHSSGYSEIYYWLCDLSDLFLK